MQNPIFFKSQKELHNWFKKNSSKVKELLIGFYNVKSGKGGITYKQALDEALCFGWIDGIRKNYDLESYTIRFTPRKEKSKWSKVNIKRAKELIELGLMQSKGLEEFNKFDPDNSIQYSYENRPQELDSGLENEFRQNKKAWNFFESQPPSYKKICIFWVMSAKREDTRLKRFKILLSDSDNNQRVEFMAKWNSKK